MTFRPLTLAMEISSFSDSVSGPCVYANTRVVYTEVVAIKIINLTSPLSVVRPLQMRFARPIRFRRSFLFKSSSGRPSATASESRAQYYVHATRTLARHRDRRSDTDLYHPSGRDRHWDEGFGYPIRNGGVYACTSPRVMCVWKKSNTSARRSIR